MAATNVWVSNWPAWNCKLCCPPCCAAPRRCGSRCRSMTFRSNMTRWPTASTSFPSHGDAGNEGDPHEGTMMSSPTRTGYPKGVYPEGVIGAPKHRRGHAAEANTGLPSGTEVFSAGHHISLADDIFYDRFPDDLKDQAPRVWYEDGAYLLGPPGQSMVVGDFRAVLMQYDDLAGAATNNIEARVAELAE